MTSLLDTNICSGYLRQHSLIYQKVMQHAGQLAVSAITWGELYTWAMHPAAGPNRNTALTDFINDVHFLPVEIVVAETFGSLRATLRGSGSPVPELDLLIASTALAHGLTLVTNNTKDFARIPGINLQDWTTP